MVVFITWTKEDKRLYRKNKTEHNKVCNPFVSMDRDRIKTDIKLGKRIYDSVPIQFRPGWGTSLLMAFDTVIKNVPTPIKELCDIVDDEAKWKESHGQFQKIRQLSLTSKTLQPEAYLLLAEKVAKVTYNLSGQSAPFDNDSGDYIPSLALTTADYFKDKKVIDEVDRILNLHYKVDTNAR